MLCSLTCNQFINGKYCVSTCDSEIPDANENHYSENGVCVAKCSEQNALNGTVC